MSRKTKQHSKQFELDVISYRKEHPNLTQVECAKNLGIGVSTLGKWEAQFRNNDSDIPVRESGNYESDEAKEIAHSLIKREWLNRFNILNYNHAYRLVFEYIEIFYNTIRIHSHCDYMSPNEFEKMYERVNSLSAA